MHKHNSYTKLTIEDRALCKITLWWLAVSETGSQQPLIYKEEPIRGFVEFCGDCLCQLCCLFYTYLFADKKQTKTKNEHNEHEHEHEHNEQK